MPKTPTQWAYFIAAVFVAGVVINTIAKRVPELARISGGLG